MLELREVLVAAHPVRVLTALLALAALAGCAHQTAPATSPAATPANPAPGAAASPATATPAPAGSAPAASPAPASAPAPSTAASPPTRAAAGSATRAPAPKRPVAAATPPGNAAAAPAASQAPPALDLEALETRLRDTHAIGVFTKLSLKNQVDDLLAQFRSFYAGQGGLTLAGLRHSYELLLMKVVTLLQDADPGLASAVSASREAIWSILADRNKFNTL